jgi:hypothetical protein
VDVVNSIDELQHEIAHVLGLERTLADTDGFVEVAIAAEFDHDVLMVLGLERVHQVDDIVMMGKLRVDLQLLRVVVGSVVGRAGRLLNGLRLGYALDGDVLAGECVFGSEDQAK